MAACEALELAVDGAVFEAAADADFELALELTEADDVFELVLELTEADEVFELVLLLAFEVLPELDFAIICTEPICDSAPWSPFQPALPPGESIWICSSIPLAPLTMLAVFEVGSASAAGAALGFF